VAIINLIISEKLDVCKINMLVVGANFAYQKNYDSESAKYRKYYHIVNEY
jgi:hypothetical protein